MYLSTIIVIIIIIIVDLYNWISSSNINITIFPQLGPIDSCTLCITVIRDIIQINPVTNRQNRDVLLPQESLLRVPET